MNTIKPIKSDRILSRKEIEMFDALCENRQKIRNLNKKLKYFVVDETKDFSYEETVKNLKSALNWEIQHPDYMASISEMQALEHDRRIIMSL